MRVALVGCGKAKADHPMQAQLLYTGSLFVAARQYAERTCDAWLILSARWGLVHPCEMLSPYERKIDQLQPEVQGAWAVLVAAELRLRFPGPVQYVGLAGGAYLGPLVAEMRRRKMPLPEQPLAGLEIGERLRWFKENTPARPRPEQQPLLLEVQAS